MKKNLWIARAILSVAASCQLLSAHAGIPLWSFTPLTPTTVALPIGVGATVQYTVTNNSRKSHILVMTPIAGITQVTDSGNCPNPFILGYLGSCTLTLQFSANTLTTNIYSGPQVCEQGSDLQCYQPSLADSLNITLTNVPPPPPPPPMTTLVASVTAIALSVNNTTLNPALTGSPRNILIQNTGTVPATNVNYTVSPALPAGTTITPATCGTIAVGASCTLTITPAVTPSTATSTVNVVGDNTNTVSPGVSVLSYGTGYEGGIVFSIDDTTSNTASVGGKVVAQVDQASSDALWSSNNSDVFDSPGISVWGIDETSLTTSPSPNASSTQAATLITGQSNCLGRIDGKCDSTNIVTWYSAPNTSPSIAPDFYAAGLCTITISGFSDWYLPSICEAGYDPTSAGSGCGISSTASTIQNIQANLVDSGLVTSLTGSYWTSTELSTAPQTTAWKQVFATGGASAQGGSSKGNSLSVRCVRAIT
jgi:hypothetical protein